MTKLLMLLMLMLPLADVWAQHTLRGVVRDTTGTVMPYSTVYVEELQRGTLTAQNGEYTMKDVPDGEYTVRTSYVGYSTIVTKVRISGQDTNQDFALHEEVVSMAELIILPDGVDFAHYVMNQLIKNMKPLKQKVASYDGVVQAYMEKHIDLSKLPHKGLLRMAASLAGWGKVMKIMIEYPDFLVDMEEDVYFRKGKIKNSDLCITRIEPELNRKELKAVLRKDWFLDTNLYDQFYDEVKTKIKSLSGKKPKYQLRYAGSYEEDGHLIFILKYGKTQVEVVDECWQIRRMIYHANTRTINFEFHELLPGVYLPVAGRAQFRLDYDKFPHGTIDMSLGLQYRNLYPAVR